MSRLVVVGRINLLGWYDTGLTSFEATVRTVDYSGDDPHPFASGELAVLHRVSAEVFLTEEAESDVRRHISTAVDRYVAAMALAK